MRLLLAAAVLLTAAYAHAGVERAEVIWQHPTQYTDGSPLPLLAIERTEIESWRCPTGQTVPTATSVVSVPAPLDRIIIAPLEPDVWCFRARTWVTNNALPSEWTGVVSGVVTPGQLLIIYIEARP